MFLTAAWFLVFTRRPLTSHPRQQSASSGPLLLSDLALWLTEDAGLSSGLQLCIHSTLALLKSCALAFHACCLALHNVCAWVFGVFWSVLLHGVLWCLSAQDSPSIRLTSPDMDFTASPTALRVWPASLLHECFQSVLFFIWLLIYKVHNSGLIPLF